MKKLFSTFVSLFMLGAMVSAMNVAPTNFAGTWELDKAKSENWQGPQGNIEGVMLNITQDDKQVTIENKTMVGGQERAQTFTYKLDGSESVVDVPGRMPSKATLKAKWMGDGKILELNSVRNLTIQGNDVTITTKQHLELADGGKVLKIHRTIDSPQGSLEAKLTFNKK
jgi:hypothetical protein